jgi:peptidoglycan/xylan/chitin deacetylase (PgdA/CDA1 family)
LPGRPVILTFDDGYKDFIENALPALERADFSATVFVVTEKVGRTAGWDALSSTALKLMTWKDLRDLNSKGIAIGSHSSSHKDLLTLSAEEVVAEGGQSRVALLEKLDIDTEAIAFPWGGSNGAVREILAGFGYTIGLTT